MIKTFWYIIAIWVMLLWCIRGYILLAIPIILTIYFNENLWWLSLEIICLPIALKWIDMTDIDNQFRSKFPKLYSYL